MQSLAEAGRRRILCRVFAGMETGVLGGILVVAWGGLWSLFARWSVAYIPRCLADAVYRGGAALTGWSAAAAGVAFQLVSAGLVGMLAGLVFRPAWTRRRLVLLSLAQGVAWYIVFYEIFLRAFGLAELVMSLRRCLMAGHLLFGLYLASYPSHLKTVEAAFGGADGREETALSPSDASR